MKTRTLLILALGIFSLYACSEGIVTSPEVDGFVLEFSSVNPQITKAGTDGTMEGATNENTLQTIDYFIFAEGKTNEPAVYHGSYDVPSVSVATVKISFNAEFVTQLFPTGAKTCEIFAVANYRSDFGATNPTLDQLLNTSIETDFLNPLDPKSFIMVSTDEETGEIGTTTVKLTSRETTTTAYGYIQMRRVASKISLKLHVEKDAVIFNEIGTGDGGVIRTEIWRPLIDQVQIYLMHGVSKGQLSGAPFNNAGEKSEGLFDYDHLGRELTDESESREYISYGYERDADGYIKLDSDGNPTLMSATVKREAEFRAAEPFYSYPQFWEYGYTYEPYIKLVIPWERQPGTNPDGSTYGTTSRPYYYKVVCHGSPYSANEATLKSNNWYQIFLNVGILGSEIDEGEAVIDGYFTVVDWQEQHTAGTGENPEGSTDTDKETEIVGARYLSVPQELYEMHNLEDLAFPITTSHECIIADLKAVYYNYGAQTMVETEITSGFDIKIENGRIVFNHDLKNYKEEGVGSDYNVATCVFTFTLQHADDDLYSRTITIKQYPAIMITSDVNSDNIDGGGTNDNIGYVFVNGDNTTDADYGGANGLIGSNKNPNMYVIKTTVLSPESGFLIGDPRVSTVDNLGSGWSVSGTSLDNTTRTLTNYRPVDKGADNNNTIAPEFRIASSYGVAYSNYITTLEDAFRRCASYQEDGYPAGRWRVPTKAELEYMAQLTTDKKIPRLLGDDDGYGVTYYWCNSGRVGVHDGNSTETPEYETTEEASSVRCVYDEWYWYVVDELAGRTIPLEGTAKETFTWGD